MIEYSKEKSKLDLFKARYFSLKGKCEDAKTNNERYSAAREAHTRDSERMSLLEQYRFALVDNLKLAEKEYGDYKQRRLEYIESENNKKLGEIFPSDNYRINLRVDNTRKEKIIFQLVDRYGVSRSTRVSAGGLMQSVLAYSVHVDIADSLGSSIIWLDEAFAASSSESLSKLSNITEHYLSLGFQILMVEHKSEGYKNLPRREFVLIKDLDRGIVSGIEYTDY